MGTFLDGKSRPFTKKFEENFEKIFGKKDKEINQKDEVVSSENATCDIDNKHTEDFKND